MPDGRIRLRDTIHRDRCGHCGAEMTVNMTPFGDPLFLITTGWCERCQSARFGLDGPDIDVRDAARQLVRALERDLGPLR